MTSSQSLLVSFIECSGTDVVSLPKSHLGLSSPSPSSPGPVTLCPPQSSLTFSTEFLPLEAPSLPAHLVQVSTPSSLPSVRRTALLGAEHRYVHVPLTVVTAPRPAL